jgi:hypothetical protein
MKLIISVIFNPEQGDSMLLQNIDTHLKHPCGGGIIRSVVITWTQLAEGRDQWQTLLNTSINL